MPMAVEKTIRVVLYMQGSHWIAQALEYDIAAQAKTITGTIRNLFETIADTYLFTCERNGEPFAGIGRAPDRFHKMFDEAKDDEIDFDISPRVLRRDLPVQPHLAARILEDCAA